MTLMPYWELNVFAWLLIGLIVVMALAVAKAWWDDRKKWRHIPRHMGSTFDASSDKGFRANVDLRRVR